MRDLEEVIVMISTRTWFTRLSKLRRFWTRSFTFYLHKSTTSCTTTSGSTFVHKNQPLTRNSYPSRWKSISSKSSSKETSRKIPLSLIKAIEGSVSDNLSIYYLIIFSSLKSDHPSKTFSPYLRSSIPTKTVSFHSNST